jgi:hypothetical protein
MAERLNFREACQRAGVSRQRLNEAIRSGRLPAARGGGPGKPTYIQLEELQAWCASEGLAIPVGGLERSERLNPQELTAFLETVHSMMTTMIRLERSLESVVERLERSQAQAIAQGIAQAVAQLSTPAQRTQADGPSTTPKDPPVD